MSSPSHQRSRVYDGIDKMVQNASIYLDGESLVLPDRGNRPDEYVDEVSSINSSMHHQRFSSASFLESSPSNIRIVGTSPSSKQDSEGEVTLPEPNSPSSTGRAEDFNQPYLPHWALRAPCTLKLMFFSSLILLFSALILIALSLVAAISEGGTASQSFSNVNSEVIVTFAPAVFLASVPSPLEISTLQPQAHLSPSEAPSTTHSISPSLRSVSPTVQPSLSPTDNPTVQPSLPPSAPPTVVTSSPPSTSSPSRAPTFVPSTSPSGSPSSSPSGAPSLSENKLVFYVTSGRFEGSLLSRAHEGLTSIPQKDGRSFLVHLGNWNKPSNGCGDDQFRNVKEMFLNSAVPVYFVVGENEYLNCEDPNEALGLWRDHLVGFERENWDSVYWDIYRNSDYSELFYFHFGKVLVASLNLVDGEVLRRNTNKYDRLIKDSLDWVDELYYGHRKRQDYFVLFVQGGPTGESTHVRSFFRDLFDEIPSYRDMHFILVHQGDVNSSAIESEYDGIRNLDVIAIQAPLWPPPQVTIDFTEEAENPISLDLDQWYKALI